MTVMDNDVKNLFQRAGKTVAGYQEINRQQENEEARQRWPLLRDIRLELTPDQLPPDEPVETNKLPLFGGMAMPEISLRPDVVSPQGNVSALADIPVKTNEQQKSVFSGQTTERGTASTELFFTKQTNQASARNDTGDADRLFSAILGKPVQAAEQGHRTQTQSDSELNKEVPVSDLFRRLAQGSAKPPAQTPAPSFFRKIFGS
ncbi:cellulose biosynthesis protein BcsP [Undibacterium luofuense]|uniref:Uncharacterized protein n=1 Tax=Undibacterium luofuense TaxID=2828733 RepID=A0A941DMM9_9BURK|nr:cellulose biosynthesis protein BcsP [Undibacterium luofuense]MBR7782819.1 hypothetical protein [Undibacterium luofuense]